MLNATAHRTDLEMAQALAHESGHNLLFGLSADGPLVENDDTTRYASRPDPRLMDGIVHATYVTARMHWAVIASDGRLSERGRAAMTGAHADMQVLAERDMQGAQG